MLRPSPAGLPPNGFTCPVDTLDAKVGGSFHMAFRNFGTGNEHSFGPKVRVPATSRHMRQR
jgi:hypothetical protein